METEVRRKVRGQEHRDGREQRQSRAEVKLEVRSKGGSGGVKVEAV